MSRSPRSTSIRGTRPWPPASTRPGRGGARGRVDVIGPPGTGGARPLGAGDYERLGRLLGERYPLTMIDPAPSGLPRVLSLADQLVLVTPASPEAATALAHTQQWLTAHGYDELAARAGPSSGCPGMTCCRPAPNRPPGWTRRPGWPTPPWPACSSRAWPPPP